MNSPDPGTAITDPVATPSPLPVVAEPRLPWSTSTVLGWAALALGTVATIVIVVIAVTLP